MVIPALVRMDAVLAPAVPAPGHAARITELHGALIEVQDTWQRAEIHLELGALALKDGRVEMAARHFKEALILEPAFEAAERRLAELGMSEEEPQGRLRGAVQSLLGRLRR